MDDRTRALVQVSTFASRPEHRDKLREALAETKDQGIVSRAELYECLLQVYLFAGFPAALEAMRALNASWPEPEKPQETVTPRDTISYPDFLDRGEKLFEQIYAKNAERVRAGMKKLSPELGRWAMIDGYTKTLSRPALDARTRELAIVAVLTQLGWDRQLLSHMLGALNLGASRQEVRTAVEIGAIGDKNREENAWGLLERQL